MSFFFRGACGVMPAREAGGLGDVLKNDRAIFDKTAGGDGPVQVVKLCLLRCGSGHSTLRIRTLPWSGEEQSGHAKRAGKETADDCKTNPPHNCSVSQANFRHSCKERREAGQQSEFRNFYPNYDFPRNAIRAIDFALTVVC